MSTPGKDVSFSPDANPSCLGLPDAGEDARVAVVCAPFDLTSTDGKGADRGPDGAWIERMVRKPAWWRRDQSLAFSPFATVDTKACAVPPAFQRLVRTLSLGSDCASGFSTGTIDVTSRALEKCSVRST